MVLAILGLFSSLALAGNPSMPVPGVYLNSAGSPLIPLLQSASQSIDIEIYTIKDPTVHQLIRDALARKVRVRILKDPTPLGDVCNEFLPTGQVTPAGNQSAECSELRKLVQDVRAAGGTFEPFDKANLCPNGGKPNGNGCFEHGKIAIADGQTALISTGNFDDTNLCIASENPSRCNRDFSVIENDPTLVRTLENIFQSDLAGNSYDVRTLIPSSLAGALTVSPYSLQPILDFINSAKSTIDLETQYLKDSEMNAALMNAAKRGVKVNVTVASFCAFGAPSSYEAQTTQKIYGAFDNAGISSAIFNVTNTINGHAGYMHAKVIVVDGTNAWIGSENGSTESLTQNREYGIILNGSTGWVSGVLDVVRGDHSNSNVETWSQSLSCTKDVNALGAKVSNPVESTDVVPVAKKTRRKKNPPPAA